MNYTQQTNALQHGVEARAKGMTAEECMAKKRYHMKRYCSTYGTTDGAKHRAWADLWFTQFRIREEEKKQ